MSTPMCNTPTSVANWLVGLRFFLFVRGPGLWFYDTGQDQTSYLESLVGSRELAQSRGVSGMPRSIVRRARLGFSANERLTVTPGAE